MPTPSSGTSSASRWHRVRPAAGSRAPPGEPVARGPARRERTAGGVGEVEGRAEDAQSGVALELVDPPAVAGDRLHDHREEAIEQLDDLLRCARLGQAGRADDVDEQHGRLALLATESD